MNRLRRVVGGALLVGVVLVIIGLVIVLSVVLVSLEGLEAAMVRIERWAAGNFPQERREETEQEHLARCEWC